MRKDSKKLKLILRIIMTLHFKTYKKAGKLKEIVSKQIRKSRYKTTRIRKIIIRCLAKGLRL
jgi:hypothetical protein